ncbi:hypothetical protein [Nocardia sp. NPDC019395]|uniref:hypothetical protein n=1 Tax=Nocardia sp. NPDC019395 TaxID=3154686 RepID=UPI0033E4DE82
MDGMRIGRWAVVAGLLISAPGCAASAGPQPGSVPAELGTEFTLAVGDTGLVDHDRVAVLFREVAEDSRCPAGADCVWEGDATVVTELTVDGTRSPAELHSSGRFATEVTSGGYRVALRAVHPEPPRSGQLPPSAYRVDLLVTRA